jgi:hypothetical protein
MTPRDEAQALLAAFERDPEQWTEPELREVLTEDGHCATDANLLSAAPRLLRALLAEGEATPVVPSGAICACGTTMVCPDIGCDLNKPSMTVGYLICFAPWCGCAATHGNYCEAHQYRAAPPSSGGPA